MCLLHRAEAQDPVLRNLDGDAAANAENERHIPDQGQLVRAPSGSLRKSSGDVPLDRNLEGNNKVEIDFPWNVLCPLQHAHPHG